MTLRDKPLSFINFTCALLIAGCGNGSSEQDPPHFTLDGGAPGGCIQPFFPEDQPDLRASSPPRFLLTSSAEQQSSSGQAVVEPGDAIEAEVTVNGATRLVRVELANAWSPDEIIFTGEFETAGNETLALDFDSPSDVAGRFYMKLTLCGSECNRRQIVFDINPDVNSPYERRVVELGETLQVDETCLDFGARPGIGSGTILIQ